MKKLSRMESNKEARRVLAKHAVDLSYCQYSCCGCEVMLSGSLYKNDGSDFTGPQIQAMIGDFQRFLAGFSIQGDFDNWKFNSESISFIGDRNDNNQEQEEITYAIDDYEVG